MQFYNFIVPSISSPLTLGHISAEKLYENIKNHSGSEAYHSLFDLENRDDFKSYQGVVRPALGFFVLDFDSLNLEDARKDVIKLVTELKLQQAWFFFSGSKGFHLYINASFFQVPENKEAVRRYQDITSLLKSRYNLTTLDDGIVQANRKFRLPNSKHPKTGLYKIQIGWTELNTLPIDAIKEKAKTPGPLYFQLVEEDHYFEPNNSSELSKSSTETLNGLGDFGFGAVTDSDLNDGNIFKEYDKKVCISRMWTADLEMGERHAVASILIADAFHTKMDKEELYGRMERWAFKQGIQDRFKKDFIRMIDEQYSGKREYSYGCYYNIKKKFCSGTCALYTRLSPDKRAVVDDLPREAIEAEEKKLIKKEKINHKKEQKEVKKSENFIQGFPQWGTNAPLGTLDNVAHLLKELNISARYDVIKKDLQIIIPEQDFILDTAKNDKMNNIISFAMQCKMPYAKLPDFVGTLAARNPYNPVAEWIQANPWDGVSRLGDFYNTVVAKDEDIDPKLKSFKELLMRKWMISAIAGAFLPNGVSAGGVLVFTGAQFIGKTNWFKNLVPKELGVLKDGQLLDPKDKDSVHQCVSNWLVELGELDATFRRAEIAQLKAFITKDQDTIRLPYQREPASFARRTVFFGSVNDLTYLNDPTGNRRFWTINTVAINHTHGLPMQQIWAEVYALFKANPAPEAWNLTQEENSYLGSLNEIHTVMDPVEEILQENYELNGDLKSPGFHLFTCTEIARVLGYIPPSKRDINAIATALRKFKSKEITLHGRRGFVLKPLFDKPGSNKIKDNF